MGVTIRDVAREAGVSPSTVSRAFNKSALVKPATQERIMEVAQRLRYVPNGTARALSIKKTHVVGFIVPYPHREFFSEVIRGVDETTQQAGYMLQTSSSHNRLEDTRTLMRVMHGRIDGLIILSPHFSAQELRDDLPRGIPTVFMLSDVEEGFFDAFAVDNVAGGYAATRHLLDLGHRRIAIIKGLPENREAQDRLKGYRQALEDAGITPDPDLELPGDFSQASGYEATEAMLRRDLRPPALFATNDYMAFGALSALQKAGLDVPGDVAIIGYDDILSARYVNPALSTMRVPALELSRRAASRLIDLVERDDVHEEHEPEVVTLTPDLVVRASTTGRETDRS